MRKAVGVLLLSILLTLPVSGAEFSQAGVSGIKAEAKTWPVFKVTWEVYNLEEKYCGMQDWARGVVAYLRLLPETQYMVLVRLRTRTKTVVGKYLVEVRGSGVEYEKVAKQGASVQLRDRGREGVQSIEQEEAPLEGATEERTESVRGERRARTAEVEVSVPEVETAGTDSSAGDGDSEDGREAAGVGVPGDGLPE